MCSIKYYSTNNKAEKVNFETALLNGLASEFGLYMISRQNIPKLTKKEFQAMSQMSYADIAFLVINKFIGQEIPKNDLRKILNEAYNESIIPTKIQHLTGSTHIMWLTQGPTYSFKDYAARFFGRTLNYFLEKNNLKRTVIVATSGDTGGAVADALNGLNNIKNIVFFPADSISEEQKKQMTTLGNNIYAFSVNGDFDICQSLAKRLLGDKKFAKKITNDEHNFTSANSISLGRLLPQTIYPFFAYSKIANYPEKLITSIPSGNFGDMMGTVIAKEMGLPISKIICGVNENKVFPNFLNTKKYKVVASKKSPSSAMIVSNPSNLARLIDFYDGHIYDQRDSKTKKIMTPGIIDKMPNMEEIKNNIISISVNNENHYQAIKDVYDNYQIILEPHGAVGWHSLNKYLNGQHDQLSVIYETADPGKFPEAIKKSINIRPKQPKGIKVQSNLPERIFTIKNAPDYDENGLKLSDKQVQEAKEKIKELFK